MENRIIGEITGDEKGPLLIFIGGMHGNEIMGVSALEQVFSDYKNTKHGLKGRAVALRGNLRAIDNGVRFLSRDLNRIWNVDWEKEDTSIPEYAEYIEIREIIERELRGDFTSAYLLDLHTTSGPTVPFAVTKKSSDNLQFINAFNIPFITGLGGFIEGTLLEWMCRKGHCGLAFESGDHYNEASKINHMAFIRLCMKHTGFDDNMDESEQKTLSDCLEKMIETEKRHFRLKGRYKISKEEEFKMCPGYSNFDKISRTDIIASNKFGAITAKTNAYIFMPLYQEQGDDGFFIIEPN